MTWSGHCLCGSVRFRVEAEVRVLVSCHCRFCRRAQGAAFVTTAPVPTDAIHVEAGSELIARHEGRFFCSRCAGRLWNRGDRAPGLTAVMAASLDPEPAIAPALHVNVESKAPWHAILDDAPQHEGFPDEW